MAKFGTKGIFVTALISLAIFATNVRAQNPRIQVSLEHPTDQLWFINARNTDTRTVSIDGGMLSDCVEVTNCDGSGFSHNIILKPGESAHVGDVTRAICTNPTDDNGNEIRQCEKRPPTTFKYQVFARFLPDAQQSKPRSSNEVISPRIYEVAYGQSTDPSPNLSDTMKWLQDTIEAHHSYSRWGQSYQTIGKVNGCTMTVQGWMYRPTGHIVTEQCVVDLTELDITGVSSVNTPNFGPVARLVTRDNKQIACSEYSDQSNSWSDGNNTTFTLFNLDSMDIADRVAKAFLHAETLCGAKKPLF